MSDNQDIAQILLCKLPGLSRGTEITIQRYPHNHQGEMEELGLKSLSYLDNQEGGVEEGGAEEGGAEEGGVEETGVGECGVEEGGAEECEAEESGVEECTRPRSTGRVAHRNLSSLCTR